MIVGDVKALWARIQATSWEAVFQAHGVPSEVEKWPEVTIAVDRTQKGFEDFAGDARRAIEPGDPARSLVYHALASPGVRPKWKPEEEKWYPSIADLDLIENYVYSLKPLTPEEIAAQNLVPAVFAYEYRVKGKSTHRQHADLVFSRTGIARVGSLASDWDGENRCFTNGRGTVKQFAVTPARYGVFLARPRAGDGALSVMGTRDDDDVSRTFLLPVHKLFDGTACVAGHNLTIDFSEMHINEKLRRLVQPGKIRLAPGLDADRAPFVRRSRSTTASAAPDADRLVDLVKQRGSVTVASPPADLVRLAVQRPGAGGPARVASFNVPKICIISALNRRYTSLELIESLRKALLALLDKWVTGITGKDPMLRPRDVPEFANIRHRVKDPADPNSIEILGEVIPRREDFIDTVSKGDYPAALYEDSICEGAIGARIGGLAEETIARPAYSLVAAPDFFPLADAMDLEEWVWKHDRGEVRRQMREGSAEPLCFGRFPVNPAIRSPYGGDGAAFDRDDQTMVAIVGRPMAAIGDPVEPGGRRSTGFLTDAASNEFAPGWDVTFAEDEGGKFYATYGLGSPFPEDTKLCAAANGYWPAASPDASRTFRRTDTPTSIPLLDEELGYHPNHPKVLRGEVAASRGWDGEYGPFFEPTANGRRCVNYADIMRSDYVSNVLKGYFDRSKLARADSRELIRRMECLRFCIKRLPVGGDSTGSDVSVTQLWMVSAEARNFDDPNERPDERLDKGGKGYKFDFVCLPRKLGDKQVIVDEKSFGRLLQPFDGPIYSCFVGQRGLCWKADDAPLAFIAAPPGAITA